MKALVLGGTRYMGIHLVNELLSYGYDVTIATRGITPDPFGDRVTRLIVDRRDRISLCNAFNGKFYDVTVDNIAYSSNDVRFLLESLETSKYVMTSTASVYFENFHEGLREEEVDTKSAPLKWCNVDDFPYHEVKRQAEAALLQAYPGQASAAVRFPYIFGADDYSKRLYYYVEHIVQKRAMNINNLKSRLSFINSSEAGRFLAYAVKKPIFGNINASSNGTISLEEIIQYVEERTFIKAVVDECADSAPFNDVPSFSLDTSIAAESGFVFLNINDWVYPLLDHWIDSLKSF